MINNIFSKFIKILLIFVFSFQLANAETKEDARQFITQLADNVLSIINNPQFDEQTREVHLTQLFKESVDIEWIGQFALGKYGRTITPEQKEAYNEVFAKLLINNYVPNFKKYTKETFEILNVIASNKGEFLVQTEINKVNGKTNIKVDYAVKKNAHNKFKIFDIVAENVSLISTQRSEFTSILSREDITSLINDLNRKLSL